MATKATIGGKIILGSSDAAWTLQNGVEPAMAEFDLRPEDAQSLIGGELGPVKFVIESDEGGVEIGGLYVIRRAPGPNPHIDRVLVADQRFFWSYNHVRLFANWRRKIGVKRVTQPGAAPETYPVVDDIKYAPWSLEDDTRPWTAQTALKAITDRMQEALKKIGGPGFKIDLPSGINQIPVENLQVDHVGGAALARVLGYFPEAAVTVDADGKARIYSRVAGGDDAVIEGSRPEAEPGGHVEWIKHARERPSEVHVLFTREHELRFDFEELETGGTSAWGAKDDLFIENVLPIPDFSLSVGGVTMAEGTWITIAQAMAAWGTMPDPIGRQLDTQLVRRASVPFLDLWSPAGLAGVRDPDQDWASRLASLQVHFRRTYRINRRWMDRIFALIPTRVATVDPATGTRASPAVYADYSLIFSQRSLVQDIAGNHDLSFAINVTGYPSGGGFPADITSATKSIPAVLRILDHDQGIIQIQHLMDEARLHQMILPSKISNVPTGNMTSKGAPIAFNAVFESERSKVPELSQGHKVAMILTAIPAAPNSDQQFERIVVKPGEVTKYLPGALSGGLTDARGPIMEIRIGSGIETARVAWVDKRRNDIEKAFGVKKGEPKISDLVINRGGQRGIGSKGASLDALAIATAARVYAEFSDRWQGSRMVGPYADATVVGFIDALTHQVTTQGAAFTVIETGRQAPALDLTAFLKADVMAVLLKLAQPGK